MTALPLSTTMKLMADRRRSSTGDRPLIDIESQRSLTAFPGLKMSSYDFSQEPSDSGSSVNSEFRAVSDEEKAASGEVNEVEAVKEVHRGGCSRCARKRLEHELKPSVGREDTSTKDKDISLVTINEEEEPSSKRSTAVVDGKAAFILHLKKILPTEELLRITQQRTHGFKLKWNFLNESDEFNLGTNYDFNYKSTYVFQIDTFKYRFLSRCPLHVELYVRGVRKSEILLGKADIDMLYALKSVGRVVQQNVPINNRDLVVCYNKREKHYGRLVCSYQFTGDPEEYRKCEPLPVKTESLESVRSYDLKYSLSSTSVTSTNSLEMAAFMNGLKMVLIRNKALRTTQEEIANELKERTTWMHEELKWRLTLQEHAILTGNDPNLVKWRQWKDARTAFVKYRPNPNEEFNKMQVAVFEVTITELQLNPFSRISIDDSIKQIYIEYSFLQYAGSQLETISKPKNLSDSPINFDFIKTFEIRASDRNARLLAEMVKNNESIVFAVVSEPIPDRSVCQSCVEVGNCPVSIYDLVQSRQNVVTDSFPVYDHVDGGRELGKLRLTFAGLLSLRSVALQIMTPENFKIIR